MSSLLQGVLKTQSQQASVHPDSLAAKLDTIKLQVTNANDSTTPPIQDLSEAQRSPSPTSEDDELINVQSVAVSPRSVSRNPSRPTSRSHSPSRLGGAAARPAPGPLLLSPSKKLITPSKDPLKVLPSELNQRIFGMLTIRQLAKCARVSRKWSKSQTINYVWFQHYRMENFHDESLPQGKWTRRESKQNWRVVFLDNRKKVAKENGDYLGANYYVRTGASTPSYAGSGYQTPREIREEKWKQEADETKPTKNEMRDMYKELGGRKAKTKGKYQTDTTSRDRGGWTDATTEYN